MNEVGGGIGGGGGGEGLPADPVAVDCIPFELERTPCNIKGPTVTGQRLPIGELHIHSWNSCWSPLNLNDFNSFC